MSAPPGSGSAVENADGQRHRLRLPPRMAQADQLVEAAQIRMAAAFNARHPGAPTDQWLQLLGDTRAHLKLLAHASASEQPARLQAEALTAIAEAAQALADAFSSRMEKRR